MAIVSTMFGGMLGFVGFLISYFALSFTLLGAFALYFGVALAVFAVVMAFAAMPVRRSETTTTTA